MKNKTKLNILLAIAACIAGFAVARFSFDSPPIEPLAARDSASSHDTGQKSSELQSRPNATAASQAESERSNNWPALIEELLAQAPNNASYKAIWSRIHSLSNEQKLALMKEALRHENRGRMKQLLSNLIYTVAKENSQLTLKAFEEMSAKDKHQLGQTFLMGWANGDSKQLWDWMADAGRSEVTSFLISEEILLVKTTALSAMMLNPNSNIDVLAVAMSEKDLVQAQSLMGFVIGQIAKKDVNQAIDLIDEHSELSELVVEKLIEQWAKTDLSEAVDFLQSNADIAAPQSASIIANSLLQENGPEALYELHDNLENQPLKDQVALEAVRHYANQDLETTMSWIDSIEDVKMRRSAGSATIKRMGFDDNMDDHIQFLETSFGTSSDARPVYVQSLQEWQKIYPDKVIEYVDSLPPEAADLRSQLIWQLNLELE